MSDNEQPVVIADHVQGRGRPTSYKPEYCDRVVEWGKLGKSKAWICSELEIARPTLDLWIETHPDFSYAMGIARMYSQRWWEDSGQVGMAAKSIDASIWSRSMAARFPEDWREKTDNTTTINKGDGWDAIFGAVVNTSRTI